MTYGFFEKSNGMTSSSEVSPSRIFNREAISSRSIPVSSSRETYLSLSTLSCRASTILRVVSTPISEAIRASSIASRRSSSTFDLPTTTLERRSKKLRFVFAVPLSKIPIRLSFYRTKVTIFMQITKITQASGRHIQGYSHIWYLKRHCGMLHQDRASRPLLSDSLLPHIRS